VTKPYNALSRHLAAARAALAAAIAAEPRTSTVRLASRAGCSEKLVRRWRKEMRAEAA
jgi:hypothetical protein